MECHVSHALNKKVLLRIIYEINLNKRHLIYLRTVESFAPKSAPGFDVGTRRKEISAGINLIDVFNDNTSPIFTSLEMLTSFSHVRLN
jgi:hypothetical protein